MGAAERRQSRRRARLRLVMVVTTVWSAKAEWQMPHVAATGEYDVSWMPREIGAMSELVSSEDQWKMTLVAFLGSEAACGEGFEGLTLRNGQRFRPSRFMGIAVAREANFLARAAAAAEKKDDAGAKGWGNFLSSWKKKKKTTTKKETAEEVETKWPGQREECFLGMVDSKGSIERRSESWTARESAEATRERVAKFVRSTAKVEGYRIKNELDRKVRMWWFDSGQEEGIRAEPWREIAVLDPKTQITIGSFISHVFAAQDFETGAFLAKFVVNGPNDEAVVDSLSLADAASCPASPRDHNAPAMYRLVDDETDPVKVAARELVFDLAMDKRMALSDVQSRLVPNVTEDGFKLVKMPSDLYNRVLKWYHANHQRYRQPESDGGPLYNQRFIPTLHTPLPAPLKSEIFDGLRLAMEAWAPTTAPLSGTSAYGVRTYLPGSYLHLHVDTANTHVVSGIVNVDQKCDSPWPVHILDHSDHVHEIDMAPGDMLLYESAKLLHGRTLPSNCSMYANIFVHYAPQGWSVPL